MSEGCKIDLEEEALLGVHKLSLRDGDAELGGIKMVHALQEAAKSGAQLAAAVPRRLQVPARVRHVGDCVACAAVV